MKGTHPSDLRFNSSTSAATSSGGVSSNTSSSTLPMRVNNRVRGQFSRVHTQTGTHTMNGSSYPSSSLSSSSSSILGGVNSVSSSGVSSGARSTGSSSQSSPSNNAGPFLGPLNIAEILSPRISTQRAVKLFVEILRQYFSHHHHSPAALNGGNPTGGVGGRHSQHPFDGSAHYHQAAGLGGNGASHLNNLNINPAILQQLLNVFTMIVAKVFGEDLESLTSLYNGGGWMHNLDGELSLSEPTIDQLHRTWNILKNAKGPSDHYNRNQRRSMAEIHDIQDARDQPATTTIPTLLSSGANNINPHLSQTLSGTMATPTTTTGLVENNDNLHKTTSDLGGSDPSSLLQSSGTGTGTVMNNGGGGNASSSTLPWHRPMNVTQKKVVLKVTQKHAEDLFLLLSVAHLPLHFATKDHLHHNYHGNEEMNKIDFDSINSIFSSFRKHVSQSVGPYCGLGSVNLPYGSTPYLQLIDHYQNAFLHARTHVYNFQKLVNDYRDEQRRLHAKNAAAATNSTTGMGTKGNGGERAQSGGDGKLGGVSNPNTTAASSRGRSHSVIGAGPAVDSLKPKLSSITSTTGMPTTSATNPIEATLERSHELALGEILQIPETFLGQSTTKGSSLYYCAYLLEQLCQPNTTVPLPASGSSSTNVPSNSPGTNNHAVNANNGNTNFVNTFTLPFPLERLPPRIQDFYLGLANAEYLRLSLQHQWETWQMLNQQVQQLNSNNPGVGGQLRTEPPPPPLQYQNEVNEILQQFSNYFPVPPLMASRLKLPLASHTSTLCQLRSLNQNPIMQQQGQQLNLSNNINPQMRDPFMNTRVGGGMTNNGLGLANNGGGFTTMNNNQGGGGPTTNLHIAVTPVEYLLLSFMLFPVSNARYGLGVLPPENAKSNNSGNNASSTSKGSYNDGLSYNDNKNNAGGGGMSSSYSSSPLAGNNTRGSPAGIANPLSLPPWKGKRREVSLYSTACSALCEDASYNLLLLEYLQKFLPLALGLSTRAAESDISHPLFWIRKEKVEVRNNQRRILRGDDHHHGRRNNSLGAPHDAAGSNGGRNGLGHQGRRTLTAEERKEEEEERCLSSLASFYHVLPEPNKYRYVSSPFNPLHWGGAVVAPGMQESEQYQDYLDLLHRREIRKRSQTSRPHISSLSSSSSSSSSNGGIDSLDSNIGRAGRASISGTTNISGSSSPSSSSSLFGTVSSVLSGINLNPSSLTASSSSNVKKSRPRLVPSKNPVLLQSLWTNEVGFVEITTARQMNSSTNVPSSNNSNGGKASNTESKITNHLLEALDAPEDVLLALDTVVHGMAERSFREFSSGEGNNSSTLEGGAFSSSSSSSLVNGHLSREGRLFLGMICDFWLNRNDAPIPCNNGSHLSGQDGPILPAVLLGHPAEFFGRKKETSLNRSGIVGEMRVYLHQLIASCARHIARGCIDKSAKRRLNLSGS
eukprot:g3761.t1